MTPGQCRAARIVLGWTQADLTERACVPVLWLSRFENGKDAPSETKEHLRRTFKSAGIWFEGDWGVAHKKT